MKHILMIIISLFCSIIPHSNAMRTVLTQSLLSKYPKRLGDCAVLKGMLLHQTQTACIRKQLLVHLMVQSAKSSDNLNDSSFSSAWRAILTRMNQYENQIYIDDNPLLEFGSDYCETEELKKLQTVLSPIPWDGTINELTHLYIHSKAYPIVANEKEHKLIIAPEEAGRGGYSEYSPVFIDLKDDYFYTKDVAHHKQVLVEFGKLCKNL